MRPLEVQYLETAVFDVQSIYLFLRAQGASIKAAGDYVDGLYAACEKIGYAPEERGSGTT